MDIFREKCVGQRRRAPDYVRQVVQFQTVVSDWNRKSYATTTMQLSPWHLLQLHGSHSKIAHSAINQRHTSKQHRETLRLQWLQPDNWKNNNTFVISDSASVTRSQSSVGRSVNQKRGRCSKVRRSNTRKGNGVHNGLFMVRSWD